jgi:hypothetical protein
MTPPEGRPLRRRRRATASSREQSRWGPNGKRSGLLLIEAGDLKETIQVAAKIPIARCGSIKVRPIKELRP